MSHLVTHLRAGFIEAESRSSESPSDLLESRYDLIVSASSWDKRSVVLTSVTSIRCAMYALLLFEEHSQHPLRVVHDRQLLEFGEAAAEGGLRPVRVKALDLRPTWRTLQRVLVEAVQAIRRPLRVLIDLSTCPRFYSLGLVATGLGRGLVDILDVFYSEGLYEEKSSKGEVEFRHGAWRSAAIPGLEGEYDPGKRKLFVASIGFEGGKTLRVISRADPDRVAVLLPSPGTLPDYPARTLHNNRLLLEEFVGPQGRIISAPAGDAIKAWQTLMKASIEVPERENVHYLCSGPKPHSLALALRALHTGYPSVIYSLPERHGDTPVELAGQYWLYRLQNVAVPRIMRSVARRERPTANA